VGIPLIQRAALRAPLCRTLIAFLIVFHLSFHARGQANVLDTSNGDGVLRTITLDGAPLDRTNPFFQSLGTNGRSCVSCHVPSAGWTITPTEVQDRFNKTKGLDPIFRTNDGSNAPIADVSTLTTRRNAYSMLLTKGVIRVGLPIPAGAEFELAAVDDPYGFDSASELSLFRRPMPTTNLRFLTAVMWDGRESFGPMGTTPILDAATDAENTLALFNNLKHQANDATMGHAQGAALSDAQQIAIARFELNLASAQHTGQGVGVLNARGTLGGAANLAAQQFFVSINDVFGGDKLTGNFDPHAMKLFDAWAGANNPKQAAVARGAALFGSIKIELKGVGGLNDALGIPTITASCTACHDSPNVGNHSVALPIDIGLTDESRRTLDMPLYALRNLTTGQIRKTTDPGRALLTGKWADIGKFKGPVLRGLASRAPYFHDGSAADLGDVLDFYEDRFTIGLTAQQRADLIAFLSAL
jgi:cytochrome c peroxidase